MHIKAKMLNITEWTRNEGVIAGDMSHEAESEVLARLADETRKKKEDDSFEPDGLPFEYEFDKEPTPFLITDAADVKERLLDVYVENFCPYDYLIPSDCDYEWQVIYGDQTFNDIDEFDTIRYRGKKYKAWNVSVGGVNEIVLFADKALKQAVDENNDEMCYLEMGRKFVFYVNPSDNVDEMVKKYNKQ